MFNNKLEELEKIVDYSFNNKELLLLSLIHPSYANENSIDKAHTNQRLEFLGDAVLELVSSDFLYNFFKNFPEGSLTKLRACLVCEDSLSVIARELELYNFLMIGKGETREHIKFNDSTMCDTIEAVIGAIYLDGGLDSAKKFITKFILTDENLHKTNNDYKSILQEKANIFNYDVRYEVIKESGPDHDKTFEISVYYNNKVLGTGIGKSKKEAEQNAAKVALSILEV